MEIRRAPADISPLDFFTRWIPRSVAADEPRREKLGATRACIVFELAGDEGGCFTLNIESGVVIGRAGDHAEADLRVRVDIATWRSLNAGEISAPEALLKRRLKLSGDFLLGLKLHLILS
jgi:putative sterol carrier protein